MINKKNITKSIFSLLSKSLIVFFVIIGYLLIHKTTTYAAAYPGKDTGYYFLYFTDADGTEYGYRIDINFGSKVGNEFSAHNVARESDGGTNWPASNISYTVTTILGNSSKTPKIWFDYIGNDEPGQTGHYRNFTMRFWFPRTAGASQISFVNMYDNRYAHSFTDESTSADIASNLYRTGAVFSIQEMGIKIWGTDSSDNGYDMTTTSNISIHLKTAYDPVAFDLNSTIDGNWNGDLGTWGTADVYIDGNMVADDKNDYYNSSVPYGSTYTVNDIKAKDGYVYTGETSYSGTLKSNVSTVPSFSTSETFDLNSTLDGNWQNGLYSWGTADVYINGNMVADDNNDYFSTLIPKGSTYTVNDIKAKEGYLYTGDSSYSGTINSDTSITPPFSTRECFDLNSTLDGNTSGYLSPCGTADVYVNGVKVADDATDYYNDAICYGSTYIVDDLKPNTGYAYTGPSSYSGTIKSYVSVFPPFQTVKYNINYDGNGATSGSTASSTHNYLSYQQLSQNGYSRTDCKFIGWSTSKSPTNQVMYSNNQSVINVGRNLAGNSKNFTSTDGYGTVNWSDGSLQNVSTFCGVRNDYWTGNESALEIHVGHMDGGAVGFYRCIATVPGKKYTISGLVAGHRSQKRVFILDENNNTILNDEFGYGDVYGAEDVNNWSHIDDTFTATTTMTKVFFQILKVNASTGGDDGYLWLKQFKVEEGSNATDWTYAPEDNVTNTGTVTLYAVWDASPIITAKDKYYTLEDAKNGIITQTDLLTAVTVTDDRDSDIIQNLKVTDYNSDEFKQFTSEGSTIMKYQVTDSVGNTSYTTNTVYIVDTTAAVVQENKYVRFISEESYQKANTEGGLGTNSIWKTNSNYSKILEKSMVNRRSLVQIAGSINVLGIDYSYTKPGSIIQDHIYQSWSFSPEQIRAVKEYIKTHGIGNIQEATALHEFLIEFNDCKKL